MAPSDEARHGAAAGPFASPRTGAPAGSSTWPLGFGNEKRPLEEDFGKKKILFNYSKRVREINRF